MRDISFADPDVAEMCFGLCVPDHLVLPPLTLGQIDEKTLASYTIPLANRSCPRAVFVEATLFLVTTLIIRVGQVRSRPRAHCPEPNSAADFACIVRNTLLDSVAIGHIEPEKMALHTLIIKQFLRMCEKHEPSPD